MTQKSMRRESFRKSPFLSALHKKSYFFPSVPKKESFFGRSLDLYTSTFSKQRWVQISPGNRSTTPCASLLRILVTMTIRHNDSKHAKEESTTPHTHTSTRRDHCTCITFLSLGSLPSSAIARVPTESKRQFQQQALGIARANSCWMIRQEERTWLSRSSRNKRGSRGP